MPTYKHPCPSCDQLIQRDVAACPYCGVRDPFAPRRCASCRTPLDDPSWVACPRCGAATARPAAPATPAAGTTPIVAPATPVAPPASSAAGTPPIVAPPSPATPATPAAASAAATAPAAPPAPARACSGCAAPLPEGARFCTVCGALAG